MYELHASELNTPHPASGRADAELAVTTLDCLVCASSGGKDIEIELLKQRFVYGLARASATRLISWARGF